MECSLDTGSQVLGASMSGETFKRVRNKNHHPVSEAEISNNLRGICHHPFADCEQIINRRLGVVLTDKAYWQAVWQQLASEEKRRFPHANFRT